MNSRKGFIAIMTVLIAMVMLLGFHTYKKHLDRADLMHQKRLVKEEVRDFEIMQAYLIAQVDSLQQVYDELAANASNSLLENQKVPTISDFSTPPMDTKRLYFEEAILLKRYVEELLARKESLESAIVEIQSR